MKKKFLSFPPFNDFLCLANKKFANDRLLIFHGVSGSGKTSYLNFIAYHHPFFKNSTVQWIWTHHRRFKTKKIYGKELVVVDEIVSPLQIPAVHSLLRTNLKVAVSSHLHPLWFRLFCPFIHTKSFCTDSSNEKLSTYLSRLGVPHTPSSLESFSHSYGSNYVDLQCILENAPGQSFDNALHFSQRFNQITIEKRKDWTPSLPRFNFD